MGCTSSTVTTVPRTLVLYDFDLSMMNETSDTWIVAQLNEAISHQFQAKLDAGYECWTDIIDDTFGDLHEFAGITKDQITAAIRAFPAFDENLLFMKELGEANVAQKVVSDANTVYIEVFLEHHGLRQYFSEIYSNPSHFDEEGRFHIQRFLPKEKAHSCEWCDDAPNMCKGEIFEKILSECGNDYDKILFVCDGTNDYCGSLRLRGCDVVLCRKDLGLNGRLNKHGIDSISATVEFWGDGKELRDLVHKHVDALASTQPANGSS